MELSCWRFRRGFTLIELLVGLSIIGSLLAVSTNSYMEAREVARDTERKSDIDQIQLAIRVHQEVNGELPATGIICTDATTCNASVNDVAQRAMGRIEDPQHGQSGYYYEFRGNELCANELETTGNSYCVPVRGEAMTYTWNTTGWSTCSASCGGGTQTRTVTCTGSDGSMAANSDCTGIEPDSLQSCNTQACPTVGSWTTSGWSTCSASCGGGTQTRTVTCNYDSCTGTQPDSLQPCNTQACPTVGSWTTSGWSTCTASCGGGTQTRTVTCNYDSCTGTQPDSSQPCNTQDCVNKGWPDCPGAWSYAGSGSKKYCRIEGHYSFCPGSPLPGVNTSGYYEFFSGPEQRTTSLGKLLTECRYIWRL